MTFHSSPTDNSHPCAPGTPQATSEMVTSVELQRCLSHTRESDLRFRAVIEWCWAALTRRCTRAEAARAIAGLADRCAHEIPEEAA